MELPCDHSNSIQLGEERPSNLHDAGKLQYRLISALNMLENTYTVFWPVNADVVILECMVKVGNRH